MSSDEREVDHDPPAGMTSQSSDAPIPEILASLSDDDLTPSAPPTSVWVRIESTINTPHGHDAQPSPADGQVGPQTPGSPTSGDPAAAHAKRSEAHRRRQAVWLVAAALALFATAGVLVWWRGRSDTQVIATAQLRHEDGFDPVGTTAEATARLIERDGTYEITLVDPDLPGDLGEPADLELWLIESRADGTLDVRPVAVIDDDAQTFKVPDGIDPTTHNIVDISVEPRDGDSEHSGRSILRGPLVKA